MSRSGTLASRSGTCDEAIMTVPPERSGGTAGGFLVAVGALGGAAIGFSIGEATPGFLIGLGVGAAAALLVWWRGRG